jgi:uncharacterized membrane protein HdeD (DUF308 family)
LFEEDAPMMTTAAVEVDADEVGPWWMFLATGILWLILSFIILSLDFDTVWAIAILAGMVFIFGGITEIAMGTQAPGWRWLYYLMGVIGILAGIVAFVWPGQTFIVLAAILGWYLLFRGLFDIVNSFVNHGADFWWLELIVGIAEVLVGFWAVGYPGNSAVLLALWVGVGALARGITSTFLAFRVKAVQDRRA